MRSLVFLALVASFSLESGENEEIAFEEPEVECQEECHTRHRYHRAPPPTIEEEEMYRELTESHWPGKRDNNLIDQFSHY